MQWKKTFQLEKAFRLGHIVLPIVLGLLYIAVLFPYAVQGIDCAPELLCLECNVTTNGTQYCTKCATGYGLLIDQPNATRCQRCGLRCTSCSIIGKVCEQCVPTFGPIFNGSGKGSCGPCVSIDANCPFGCDRNGAGKCDRCDTGFGLTNGDAACSQCVPHCSICDTNITYCDICNPSYFFYPNRTCGLCADHCTQYKCLVNGAEKCDRCDGGYGLTTTKTCALCAPNCQTYGCATNGAGKCDQCDLKYALTPTNTCAPCTLHCTTYGCAVNGAQKCDHCDPGFSLTPTNTCPPVCADHCTKYKCLVNGAEKCDRCDDGYGLTATNTCAPCYPNCTKYGCAVNGAGRCDRCDPGFVLIPTNTCTQIVVGKITLPVATSKAQLPGPRR